MVSASYGFLRNGLICLLLSTFFVCAISYVKVTPKQTLADEIRPIIESCVSDNFDKLKSEHNILNEKVVTLIKKNENEVQCIKNILDNIQADVTICERYANETKNLKTKSANEQLEPTAK